MSDAAPVTVAEAATDAAPTTTTTAAAASPGRPTSPEPTSPTSAPRHRKAVEPDRVLVLGAPDYGRCDNKVISARYTALSFLPKAIMEQFRRFANIYFLTVGCIMAIGYYTNVFDSAVSPWTTLGPLALVVSFSLLVEGSADLKRHRNDAETNYAPCTVLVRAEDPPPAAAPGVSAAGKGTAAASTAHKSSGAPSKSLAASTVKPGGRGGFQRDSKILGGKDTIVNVDRDFFLASGHPNAVASVADPRKKAAAAAKRHVRIAYQRVARQDIRQGHFVLVKNREMVPADMVLLASSNDQGSAYIETSSIDGETNLKLRHSPQLPKQVLKHLRDGTLEAIGEEEDDDAVPSSMDEDEDEEARIETIQMATKRLARMSYLGHPTSRSVMEHPEFKELMERRAEEEKQHQREEVGLNVVSLVKESFRRKESGYSTNRSGYSGYLTGRSHGGHEEPDPDSSRYIAALTTEPPNASVHTFGGRLTLPPFEPNGHPVQIPLDAENVLLRGAVVRNTEWVIGVAFFTGVDSKLVQNSFETKSKFSQLDRLMNKTVAAILVVMICCIIYLSSMATYTTRQYFDELFYIGYSKDTTVPWPYLPNLPPPKWSPTVQNWLQYFFMYVTLLTNFVPLSLYVTVELITFTMLWFVYVDLEMYDDTTDTRALAKSTIVTDLGRIQYIFSDKTGTLTQNVMRFKRCSVDGMIFGAPIQKARRDNQEETEEEEERSIFYPLRQLLVGQFRTPKSLGLEGLGATGGDPSSPRPVFGQMLTFNAEMFLRVLSLCHTVVVEKDIDKKDAIGSASVSSTTSRKSFTFFGNRKRTNTGDSGLVLSVVSEDQEMADDTEGGGVDFGNRIRATSVCSLPPGQTPENTKSADGAPYGYAYQAESPDEGALVSAASTLYGFQVVSRDSSGIRLKLTSPSHLSKEKVVSGLKSGKLSLKRLAAETASEVEDSGEQAEKSVMDSVVAREPIEETWTILAVNKFDSDRKRMSILLRSPPELGNLAILFCKGADSSMLQPGVCQSSVIIDSELEGIPSSDEADGNAPDTQEWEMAQILGLQAHLGEFASEGLRTLVLGMRVIDENECNSWLESYKTAASSMQNRAEKLTAAAVAIERDLHIVGATAIEDKLQKNVPQTIATLAKAGIKLWVLTGDKRETAVEIGYSTAVLTPKMHLTEVPDNGKKHVATQISMEFIRLIKMGKLPDYQKSALDDTGTRSIRQIYEDWTFELGKFYRFVRRYISEIIASIQYMLLLRRRANKRRRAIEEELELERRRRKPIEGRRKVRKRAEKIIDQWLATEGGQPRKDRHGNYQPSDDELSLASEEMPEVFNRASSAKSLLKNLKSAGALSAPQLRENSLQQLTVHESGDDERPMVDEDALSMESFRVDGGDLSGNFDKKRRTILERLFAIDKDVRKGRLTKHLKKSKLHEIHEHKPITDSSPSIMNRDSPRALVIEGGALKHLLGDPILEEMLFAVASNCDAVIACRASPKQKAMLLNLVRQNIRPEPITLAIGDGANDVGMIQEAHVGVGISGKEGKQAVNASDFAIAQFRFLEDLILIHGRWNFFRLSTVVLFSFYKNAVMAGMLIVFAPQTLYSGTPLFDDWLIAMLNFVAGLPIIVVGLFDRCLSKEYVKNNPQVYMASRRNELITVRTLLRWVCLVFIHIFVLYYFSIPQLSYGGGMTSAFLGLMGNKNKNRDYPGNGEGGDIGSVGTVTFSSMIILLAYKVLYESKSLIHGIWPAFTCRKGVGEGFFSRVAYTWVTVTWLSLGFYLWAIVVYAQLGRMGPSQFSQFTLMTNHFLTTRTINYVILIFVPIIGIAVDVCGKLFSNLYYPTQTQIHMEIEAKQRQEKKMRQLLRPSSFLRAIEEQDSENPESDH